MIPKIIHYCWLSGDPLPKEIEAYIEGWKKRLPDYQIMLWDTNRFDINSVQWVKEAFEAKKYAFAADYIRFYALYHYGGIYLDSDVEVLKSFNDLLSLESFIGFEYTGIPEAAIIGAKKGADWIKKCLDWYKEESFYDKNGNKRQVVVPFLIKKVLEEMYTITLTDRGKIIPLNGVTVYPFQYFSPKNFYSGKIRTYSESYTIHHSMASWVKENVKTKLLQYTHILFIGLFGKKLHDYFNSKIHSAKQSKRKKINENSF